MAKKIASPMGQADTSAIHSTDGGRDGHDGRNTDSRAITRPAPVEAGRATAPMPAYTDPDLSDRYATAPITAPHAQELVTGANGLPLPALPLTQDEKARAAQAKRRTLLRLALALSLLLSVVWGFLMSPLADPVAGQPPRSPSPVALAEVEPYGVNTFLHKEVDQWKKNKTLDLVRQMGAGWIKQQFPWAEIEFRQDPRPERWFWDVKNNQNAWDKFDGIVALAEQHGVRIIARIDSAPGWSHPDNPDPKAPPSPEHMEDFGNFIQTFVERYRGRVAAIQVWNEPNLRVEWATGRAVNAAEYVEMLKTAYTHAKKADPNMIVLAAPLATNNEALGYAGNLNELEYLQQMYDAGAKPYFDVMSANAYGKEHAPEDSPSREKLNFRRVELLRQVMESNGDGNKAVWFNEYGWNASPPDMPADKLPWGRVSPEEQGEYTVRGIRYAREHWPWAGVFTIWYLRQVGDIPRSASEYYFGLVDPDFVVSQAYKAVQSATEDDVAGPGTWGPLSSAMQPGEGSRWRVVLDSSTAGGVALLPVGDGDAISMPFTGTDVRLWLTPAPATPPQSDAQVVKARYYVTVDGSSAGVAADLPRDHQGRAYIDADGTQAAEVTLVRGLGEQFPIKRHTLQIRAEVLTSDDPEELSQWMGGRTYSIYTSAQQQLDLPAIGAVTVEARRSYLLFGVVALLLLACIGLSSWALVRNRRAPEGSGQ